jgi:hypothetical protein
MLITKDWLERRCPCGNGLRFFIDTYPQGLDTEDADHLASWFHGADYTYGEYPWWLRKKWLCDLIMVVGSCRGRRFGCARAEPDREEELLLELYDYVKLALSGGLWSDLTGIEGKRLLRCLQQVAARADQR